MIEIPVFNKNNQRYGNKDNLELWRGLSSYLRDYGLKPYTEGGYSTVFDTGLKSLEVMFKNAKKKGLEEALAHINEANIAWLYLTGMSAHRLGREDEAVALLKIVLSQLGFEDYMLPGYREYPRKALTALEATAEKHGEDYINEVDAEDYVEGLKTGGGCFVATAAYGNEDHLDIRFLHSLRDNYLLQSKQGRRFVRVYYVVSPYLAALVAQNAILRWTLRTMLIKPIIAFFRSFRMVSDAKGRDS